MSKKALEECLSRSLDDYYKALNGEKPSEVYRMVTGVVERILVEDAMRRSGNNCTQAAKMLGISRSTLKNKLAAR